MKYSEKHSCCNRNGGLRRYKQRQRLARGRPARAAFTSQGAGKVFCLFEISLRRPQFCEPISVPGPGAFLIWCGRWGALSIKPVPSPSSFSDRSHLSQH
ncbi:hypothetical protein GDO78_022134 [Eleutherodactylus coqui]|uniref:Uncharacterized protein n=1 Tax=Eleutherodactylus coqui TaxID=57060 RepID=A0A8J6E2Q3_ELECQ|nr:hypothetical protein GDO78_022134 [Eleutherodactylus coqui]